MSSAIWTPSRKLWTPGRELALPRLGELSPFARRRVNNQRLRVDNKRTHCDTACCGIPFCDCDIRGVLVTFAGYLDCFYDTGDEGEVQCITDADFSNLNRDYLLLPEDDGLGGIVFRIGLGQYHNCDDRGLFVQNYHCEATDPPAESYPEDINTYLWELSCRLSCGGSLETEDLVYSFDLISQFHAIVDQEGEGTGPCIGFALDTGNIFIRNGLSAETCEPELSETFSLAAQVYDENFFPIAACVNTDDDFTDPPSITITVKPLT